MLRGCRIVLVGPGGVTKGPGPLVTHTGTPCLRPGSS